MVAPALAVSVFATSAQTQTRDTAPTRVLEVPCTRWDPARMTRNPTAAELRCRYGIRGAGRFGLAEHLEVPVYQPATPLPGTHTVGVAGLPAPRAGESFEEWEWRILRMHFAPEVRQAQRSLDLLDPVFAERLLELEKLLRTAGVRFNRRETWRSPERQAYLFQQGRSRPGGIITSTLTSWHSHLDPIGAPGARAADYDVPRSQMPLFHEIAWAVGLESYGPDSNDPGHVYLQGSENIPESELVFLRLLPRVPAITMATGRPSDELVSREERQEHRRAALAWVSEPFFPHPLPGLAFGWGEASVIHAVVAPPSPPAETEPLPPARGVIQSLLRRMSGRELR
jgi:hypothetical protein